MNWRLWRTSATPQSEQLPRTRAEMVGLDQAHATAIVDKQIEAAHDISWATKCATFAAIASAAGALIQALPAVVTLFAGKWKPRHDRDHLIPKGPPRFFLRAVPLETN